MTDSSLKDRIDEDMKAAMRAKEKLRLSTIRMLKAAIKQREIDDKTTLNDVAILSMINKMIKQRRESIKHFEAANRAELAQQEQDEIDVLEAYLPEQMNADDITKAVEAAIAAANASSMKDMGQVMGILKDQLEGRADMGAVSATVKQRLS